MDITLGLTERKYVALRRRLDDFGYHQPLPLEALLLVERLLNDLLHTTDRLSYYKDLSEKTHKEYSYLKNGVQPVLTENEKLVQDCNFFHTKLLMQIEDTNKSKQKLKAQLHAVKDENCNLQFLNSEYMNKIRNLEKEISEKNHRILKLQNENLQSVIVTSGPRKETQQKKQPKMEIDHPLVINKKWTESYLSAISQVKDPYIANMMSIADDKIASLTEELEKFKRQNRDNEEVITSLRNKLLSQEKEIYHLKLKVDGMCCLKHFDPKEPQSRSIKDLTPLQMGEELKILEKTNKDLKRQLKDSRAKQHEAMEQAIKLANRNQELEKELHDIDHVALAVEADCMSSLKENTVRVSKIQSKLESSLVRIHDLEDEILELKHKNVNLKKQVDENNKQNKGGEGYVERMLQDKRKEMEKLNQNVEYLTQKTEQLSHTIQNQKQRILELESKLLENVGAWKNDKYPGIAVGKQYSRQESESHGATHSDHIIDKEHVKFKDSCTPHETLLTNVGSDLDSAKNDVHRLEEELSALRKQQKMERESHEDELNQLKKSLAQMEEYIKKLESERQELNSGQGSLRVVIHRHESTISKLEESLKNARSDFQREKSLNSQLKTLQEQTELALLDAQARVAQLGNELSELQCRLKGNEDNHSKTNKEAEAQKKELINLRESLIVLDRDKDNLMIKIDEKTERIVALEEELKAKTSRISHLEKTVADMKKKFNITVDDNMMRSHETRNMQQEIERLQQELSIAKTQKENALRENRRIQDDLASVTNDCRISHRELEDTRREVEDLKLQLQGYVDEVRRIEELLVQKEEERNDLLEQFRNLSVEASVLESANHSLESETTDARIQLRLTSERINDLERQVDDSHSLIRSYENQISDLTRQVATLEMHLRSLENQKVRLEVELSTARELSAKLDSQKSQLTQRITSNDTDKKLVNQEITELRKEIEKLYSAIAIDKETITSLENKLSSKGKESLEHQMINQELKREIEKLRGDIIGLERKFEDVVAVDEKEDDEEVLTVHSPTNSYFSG